MEKKDMVSKESFDKYIKVQMSGKTNMLDTKAVGKLSGLQREIIIDIIKNYEYLTKKFVGN